MINNFKPTNYYECVKKSENPYDDGCKRSQLKRNNANIIFDDTDDNKNENNMCVYSYMNNEDYRPLYVQLNDLINKVKNQNDRIKDLEGIDTIIRANHILGQCISVYLVKRINYVENSNFVNWYDIPKEIYKKHNLDFHKIKEFKEYRNNQCHPYPLKKMDMIILMGSYRRNKDIDDLIDFIYDNDNKDFKELKEFK